MLLIAYADYSRHSPPNLEYLLAFLWFIFMLVIFFLYFYSVHSAGLSSLISS